jgi:hypothetical protein
MDTFLVLLVVQIKEYINITRNSFEKIFIRQEFGLTIALKFLVELFSLTQFLVIKEIGFLSIGAVVTTK